MTNIEKEILAFNAGEALVEGDIVKLNSSGDAIKVTSAEALDAVGIVYADAGLNERVSVIVRGLLDGVRVLVADTDGEAGYDSAITYGSRLLISGKAAGTYVVGQALSSDQGTGATGGDGTIVAKALEAVAGSDSEDTYTVIKAYVDFIN